MIVVVLNASKKTFQAVVRALNQVTKNAKFTPVTKHQVFDGNYSEYLKLNKIHVLKELQDELSNIVVHGDGLLLESDVKILYNSGAKLICVQPSDAYEYEESYWSRDVTQLWINSRFKIIQSSPFTITLNISEGNENIMAIADSIKKAMMELGVDVDAPDLPQTEITEEILEDVPEPVKEIKPEEKVEKKIVEVPDLVDSAKQKVEVKNIKPTPSDYTDTQEIKPAQQSLQYLLLVPEIVHLPNKENIPRRILDGQSYLEIRLPLNMGDVIPLVVTHPKKSENKPKPAVKAKSEKTVTTKQFVNLSELVAEKQRLDKAIAAARSIKDEYEVENLRKQRRMIRKQINSWGDEDGA